MSRSASHHKRGGRRRRAVFAVGAALLVQAGAGSTDRASAVPFGGPEFQLEQTQAQPRSHHPEDFPEDAEKPARNSPYKKKTGRRTGFEAGGGTGSAGTIVAGTAFIPTILVQFPDRPADVVRHKPSDFEAMLFEKGYPHGSGSMRDYYLDQSGGLFDVRGEASPVWLMAPRRYDVYAGDSFGYQTAEPNDYTLIREAVALADPLIDFCKGDTDADGYVDVIFVIHSGPGAEETNSGLWSISWSLPAAVTTDDSCSGRRVKVRDFTLEPEEYQYEGFSAPGAPANMVSIGVFAHEFGHALGLPDLYDTDGSSPGGVGPWDVMGGGTYGFAGDKPWQPMPFSAWSKLALGWVEPTTIESDSLGTAIRSVDAARDGVFNGVYRLVPNGNESAAEYFLIENRHRTGWARDIPRGGLAVWHVDAEAGDNDNDKRRLLTLVQADGLDELGKPGRDSRKGDGGDLFPGTDGVRHVGPATDPSLSFYGGDDAGLMISNIGVPGVTTLADLVVSGRLPAATGSDADGNKCASGPSLEDSLLPVDLPLLDLEAPDIGNLEASPDPFVPSRDRRRYLKLCFTLSENAVISAMVLREGELVKKLAVETPRSAGPVQVTWTGKNRAGRLVPPRTYGYRITAVDAAGNESTAQGTVRVRKPS